MAIFKAIAASTSCRRGCHRQWFLERYGARTASGRSGVTSDRL